MAPHTSVSHLNVGDHGNVNDGPCGSLGSPGSRHHMESEVQPVKDQVRRDQAGRAFRPGCKSGPREGGKVEGVGRDSNTEKL